MTPTPYGQQPYPPQRPMPMQPPPRPTRDDLDRAIALAVSTAVTQGYRVETQAAGQAILVKGGRTNHILHLILTIITAGLWAIAWIIIALANRQRTLIIRVDQYGNISRNYS